MKLSRRTAAQDEVFPGGKAASTRCNKDNNVFNNTAGLVKKQGNRCAHDKNNLKIPEWYGVDKKRPNIIEEANRRIFSNISNKSWFRFPEFSGLLYHLNDEGKGRKIRSERVEGTYSLALPTLLQHLDIHKMACGHYDNRNIFRYYNYSFIKEKTDQTYVRIKREMKLLQDRGIINVINRCEINEDGEYEHIETRIEFTEKIFEMLDLTEEYLRDRETSCEKFHERQSKIDKNKKRLEVFRKKSKFDQKKLNKKSKTYNSNLQIIHLKSKYNQENHLLKKGNGEQVNWQIQNLVAAGHTIAEAFEIVKSQYPPPH